MVVEVGCCLRERIEVEYDKGTLQKKKKATRQELRGTASKNLKDDAGSGRKGVNAHCSASTLLVSADLSAASYLVIMWIRADLKTAKAVVCA